MCTLLALLSVGEPGEILPARALSDCSIFIGIRLAIGWWCPFCSVSFILEEDRIIVHLRFEGVKPSNSTVCRATYMAHATLDSRSRSMTIRNSQDANYTLITWFKHTDNTKARDKQKVLLKSWITRDNDWSDRLFSYTSECQKSVYGGPLTAIDMEPCGQVSMFYKNLIYICKIDCVSILSFSKFASLNLNCRVRFWFKLLRRDTHAILPTDLLLLLQ